MSIASEISRLQQAKADLKTSIEAKGVTVPSSALIDDYPDYVDAIPQGGGNLEEKDVNFYDYDGTLLHAYTKAEFLALTAMPSNPTHQGLTSQGWNWTLADAKEYVTAYGGQCIGQNYITDDGKTRLYIVLDDPCVTTQFLTYGQTVSNGVTINWGDGTPEETWDGTGTLRVSHTYSTMGEYMITLLPTTGCNLSLGGGNTNSVLLGSPAAPSYNYNLKKCLKKVEIGTIYSIASGCFHMTQLETITVPTGLTTIPSDIFQYTYSLKAFIVPSGVTTIGGSAFDSTYELSVLSLPKSLTTFSGQYTINRPYKLKNLYCPVGLNSTANANFASFLISAKRIVVPGVKSLPANAFSESCESNIVVAPDLVTIGKNAFSYNRNIKKLDIPSSVTSIGTGAFSYCYALEEISIPQNITTLNGTVFYQCYCLSKITIPVGVTTIGTNCFNSCYCLGEITCLPTVPPAIQSSTFNTNPPYQKIIVPVSSISDYQAATNWSSIKHVICAHLETQPTEVEYLYSDGNGQYMNTFIRGEVIGKIKIKLKNEAAPTGTSLSADGALNVNTSGFYGLIGLRGSEYVATWGGASYTNLADFDTDWHEIEVDVLNKTAQFDDSTPVALTSIYGGPYSMASLYIFGYRSSYTASVPCAATYRGYVKIWDKAGVLVRDMVPVVYNGVGYMYDKVEHLLIPNHGTGSFTVGPNV